MNENVVGLEHPLILEARRKSEACRREQRPGMRFYKGEWMHPDDARYRQRQDELAISKGLEPSEDAFVAAAKAEIAMERRRVQAVNQGALDPPVSRKCPVCTVFPDDKRERFHEDLKRGDRGLFEIAAEYGLKPSQVSSHASNCMANYPLALRAEKAALARMAAVEAFGMELVEGVRGSLRKSQDMLETLSAFGPSLDVAKAWIQLAKAQASILDGALARAERKRVMDAVLRAEEARQQAEAAGGAQRAAGGHHGGPSVADLLGRLRGASLGLSEGLGDVVDAVATPAPLPTLDYDPDRVLD